MGIEMFSTCRCRCRQVSRPAQHHPWLSKSHHIRVDGFASGLRFVPMLKTPRNRKIVKMLKLNRSENCVSAKISMIFVDENFMKNKITLLGTLAIPHFQRFNTSSHCHLPPTPSDCWRISNFSSPGPTSCSSISWSRTNNGILLLAQKKVGKC